MNLRSVNAELLGAKSISAALQNLQEAEWKTYKKHHHKKHHKKHHHTDEDDFFDDDDDDDDDDSNGGVVHSLTVNGYYTNKKTVGPLKDMAKIAAMRESFKSMTGSWGNNPMRKTFKSMTGTWANNPFSQIFKSATGKWNPSKWTAIDEDDHSYDEQFKALDALDDDDQEVELQNLAGLTTGVPVIYLI